MTANAMKGDKENCLAAGMDDYLTKPINPDTLHAMLNKWLRKDASTPPTAPVKSEAEKADEEDIIWDKDDALKRLAGKEAILIAVTQTYLDDMTSQFNALHEAIEDDVVNDIQLHAHSING